MQITRISKENESFFRSLLPPEDGKERRDLIRFGIIDDALKAVGALSATSEKGFIEIGSLYILPGYRRKGYGRALILFLEEILSDTGIESLRSEYPEDEAAEAFSKALGFRLFDDSSMISVSFGSFLRSGLYRRRIRDKKATGVRTVSALSLKELKLFQYHVRNMDYDPDWSTVIFEDGSYRSSFLLQCGENHVDFINFHSAGNSASDIIRHIRAVFHKITESFQDKADVEFRIVLSGDRQLDYLSRLLGGEEHIRKRSKIVKAVKILYQTGKRENTGK